MKSIIKYLCLTVFLLLFSHLFGQNQIVNNNAMRFGNGLEPSINASGNLKQPFYFASSSSSWKKLTFSDFPFDILFAINGNGSDEWNYNGDKLLNPVMSNIVFDASGFNQISSTIGYGTLIVRGDVSIAGSVLTVENRYEISNNQQYIKASTRISNNTASAINNFRPPIALNENQ